MKALPTTRRKRGQPQERELEILGLLEVAMNIMPSMDGWLTPMFCGGSDGSHHSKTLAKLVRHGLVERKERGGWTRGSFLYRITPTGRKFKRQWTQRQGERR